MARRRGCARRRIPGERRHGGRACRGAWHLSLPSPGTRRRLAARPARRAAVAAESDMPLLKRLLLLPPPRRILCGKAAAQAPAPSVGVLDLKFGCRRPSSLPPLHELELGRWGPPPSPLRLPSSSSLPRLPGGGPDRGAATAEAGPAPCPRLASSAECAQFGGNGGLRFGRVSDKECRCSSFYCILELKDGLQVAAAASLRGLNRPPDKGTWGQKCRFCSDAWS